MLSFERPVRVFLADEQPIFLIGLRACLAEQLDIDVVSEAHSASHLARITADIAPDIAIISVNFNGAPVIESMLANMPGQRIIALAEELDMARARKLIAGGARGYILKQSPGSVFVKAIATVLRGGSFIDLPETSLVSGETRRTAGLTEREQEILRLIALGFSIREAAARIGVTTKSAETYKARASHKLGIEGRRKIVQYAITQGWFDCISQ